MSGWRENAVTQLIALLTEQIPKSAAQIEEMPDHPSPQSFRHSKAAIWVGYHSSKGRTESTANDEMRTVRFDIGVLTRQLHKANGTCNIITAIEEAAMGATLPIGGSPLVWEGDQFTGYANGVWRYTISLSMKLPILPTVNPASVNPIQGPALKYIELEDEENGNTEVGEDPDA